MRHRLRGGFAIAGQRIPTDIDARRHDQPVVGEARAVRECHRARLRIDAGCRQPRLFDAATSELVVSEFLIAQIAQSGDDLVAERTGGKTRVLLDERDGDARSEALQRAGTGGAGKAAADHDDPAGRALRQGRAQRQRRAGGERCPP